MDMTIFQDQSLDQNMIDYLFSLNYKSKEYFKSPLCFKR